MRDIKRIRAEAIPLLVENELLEQIRVVYEDINTTSNEKRIEREKYTGKFVEKYSEQLSVSKDEVRSIVDIVIARVRWIKEIEELDEEVEERWFVGFDINNYLMINVKSNFSYNIKEKLTYWRGVKITPILLKKTKLF